MGMKNPRSNDKNKMQVLFQNYLAAFKVRKIFKKYANK